MGKVSGLIGAIIVIIVMTTGCIPKEAPQPEEEVVIPPNLNCDKQYSDCYNAIIRDIRHAWTRGDGGKTDLETKVNVHLERDGSVKSVIITESSGNRAFDVSIVASIKAASPFAYVVTENSLIYQNYYEDFEITFNPIQ